MAACTTLLCPLWLHTPCCCAPHSYTHHIAMPLMAACTTLLCLHYHASCISLPSACTFSFFFCSLVTVLLPSLPIDVWPPSPSRAYHSATTNHNNDATTTITMAAALCSIIIATTTIIPHGVMTITTTPYVVYDYDCDNSTTWHNNSDCDTTCGMATTTTI